MVGIPPRENWWGVLLDTPTSSKQRNFSELGLPVLLKDMASTVAGRSNDGDAIGDRASPVLSELMAGNPSSLLPIRGGVSPDGLAAAPLWQ